MHEPMSAELICERPAVGLGVGAHLRDRPGQVGRVGAVDVRLEGRQVDLDDLVEEALGVGVDLVVGLEVGHHRRAASAMASRPVAFR